jgi:hypothetical protein
MNFSVKSKEYLLPEASICTVVLLRAQARVATNSTTHATTGQPRASHARRITQRRAACEPTAFPELQKHYR